MAVKIGLLPLYVKMYDEAWPELRPRLESFYERCAERLEDAGLRVVRSPFCRTAEEFAGAVKLFEELHADCVTTLHMAYSPSLECVKALAGTKLPIVVFDTTETFDFGFSAAEEDVLYNHGIHGVMDMCSVLKAAGKTYTVSAGHLSDQRTVPALVRAVKAAAAAAALKGMKVGKIGGDFAGMGDFVVSDSELCAAFGAEVVRPTAEALAACRQSVSEAEVMAEVAADGRRFEILGEADPRLHAENARDGLAVRKWLESNKIGAFTANFSGICKSCGLNSMVFAEASKAMERGIGYAGEGDTLTALICGALLRSFPSSSFVEPFCPDWKGGSLHLSHMGEMNLAVVEGRPALKQIPFPFTDASEPMAVCGRYRAGSAVYINAHRDGAGFALAAADVEMISGADAGFAGRVRGWMKPELPLREFLERYSALGATHHSVLVYGASSREAEIFARFAGLGFAKL